MAKSLLRIQANNLRGEGASIKTIAKQLGVSKSSVSIWTRNILLNEEQLQRLKESALLGAERGRLKSALVHRDRRIKLEEDAKNFGISILSEISNRELLIAGLALYWGEGGKTNKRVEFCNSDPKMIKFLIRWLKVNFQLDISQFKCAVGINILHQKREMAVKKYWSEITGIPISQFYKTSFKKTINRKVYNNFDKHFGTLTVRIIKSTSLYYKILGLIEALSIDNQASTGGY